MVQTTANKRRPPPRSWRSLALPHDYSAGMRGRGFCFYTPSPRPFAGLSTRFLTLPNTPPRLVVAANHTSWRWTTRASCLWATTMRKQTSTSRTTPPAPRCPTTQPLRPTLQSPSSPRRHGSSSWYASIVASFLRPPRAILTTFAGARCLLRHLLFPRSLL